MVGLSHFVHQGINPESAMAREQKRHESRQKLQTGLPLLR
jgi:hypothetical protein